MFAELFREGGLSKTFKETLRSSEKLHRRFDRAVEAESEYVAAASDSLVKNLLQVAIAVGCTLCVAIVSLCLLIASLLFLVIEFFPTTPIWIVLLSFTAALLIVTAVGWMFIRSSRAGLEQEIRAFIRHWRMPK